MNARLSIGLLANRTGCSVPTIRYYEEIGLLPVAKRTPAGQRHYDERTIHRLVFIRRCRDFGFAIDQVRELVGLVDQPHRSCTQARDIAERHLKQVRDRLEELRGLEASLSTFVGDCESACLGGAAADCCILEELALAPEPINGLRQGGGGCCAP